MGGTTMHMVGSPLRAADTRAQRPTRQRLGGVAPKHVLAVAVPVAVLLAWWLASRSAMSLVLPSPVTVLGEVDDLLWGAEAYHTLTSLLRILLAVALSLLIGAALVALARLVPVTETLVGSVVLPLMNSVPALGWAILGVIWFGVGDIAVVVVVTLILIPFSMVNLWEGMRNLDPGLLEMARSFTRSGGTVMWRIQLPLLIPYTLAALRLSFSVGWKVALIAEFFGAEAGLGLVMNRARQSFDTATVFASIVVVLLIVIVVERLVLEPLANSWARRTGTLVTR